MSNCIRWTFLFAVVLLVGTAGVPSAHADSVFLIQGTIPTVTSITTKQFSLSGGMITSTTAPPSPNLAMATVDPLTVDVHLLNTSSSSVTYNPDGVDAFSIFFENLELDEVFFDLGGTEHVLGPLNTVIHNPTIRATATVRPGWSFTD